MDARAAHLKSDLEKEWYYRWFQPDAVVGVGFWGDVPEIVLHPRRFGIRAVLLADGYVANYRAITTMAGYGPLSAAFTSPHWWPPANNALRKPSSALSPRW